MSTSDEKKAPPYTERLQKEHCNYLKYGTERFPIPIPTVLLLKSFHIRRSLFLITGSHHNPHDFRDYSSLVHQLPIKIFLLNSQKSGQKRQSNLPPLLHPPKVGGLLSRNLVFKCSCNFTKICFPICFCISPQARQAALQPHQYFS